VLGFDLLRRKEKFAVMTWKAFFFYDKNMSRARYLRVSLTTTTVYQRSPLWMKYEKR
jgi:hypothetical protein